LRREAAGGRLGFELQPCRLVGAVRGAQAEGGDVFREARVVGAIGPGEQSSDERTPIVHPGEIGHAHLIRVPVPGPKDFVRELGLQRGRALLQRWRLKKRCWSTDF